MHNSNTQSIDIFAVSDVRDLTNENAAALSGGVADVVLRSKINQQGLTLETDKAIADLGVDEFDFDNITSSVQVQNGQVWRFYEDANFKGDFEDVGPDQARNLVNNKVSSLRAIT
jgi:Beta/Gamma crystallin